jgi:hypothetical protein
MGLLNKIQQQQTLPLLILRMLQGLVQGQELQLELGRVKELELIHRLQL